MRFFIYLFAFSFLITACKKEKNKTYTIKGRFINSCDGSPIVNQAIDLLQSGSKGGMYGDYLNGVSLRSFTDENGAFEIEYQTNHTAPLKFNLCEGIPIENLDFGDIPFTASMKVFYKVKVNNTHTSQDTLRFGFTDNDPKPVYYMNGPFHDTIIGIKYINNYGWNNFKYDANLKKFVQANSTVEIYAFYQINFNSYINCPTIKQYTQINFYNTVADTIVLNIN